MAPEVVLIGPPGSGKTTVGAALADALGTMCHDTDAAVEQAQGRTIADIFIEAGEPAFRTLERAEVARALREETGVVALGGGAPMDVGISDASKRIGFDQSRPLLSVNPRASWTRLMNERRPTYTRLATHVVDTATRTPEDIAAEIVALLGGAR